MKKNGDDAFEEEIKPGKKEGPGIVSDVKEKGKKLFNEGWENARQVFEDNADVLKKKAGELGDMTLEEITDDVKFHVRRHPLASIALAFGLGLIIGSFLKSD